ncbi:MAG: MBL fold metallo-hydrolase [Lachnospiraceae bacterium]|nr:MBL fold metallo-hydrolase [Lachnospiraceae bacterium]
MKSKLRTNNPVIIAVTVIILVMGFSKVSLPAASDPEEDMMEITAIDLGAENTGEAAMITDGRGKALLIDSGDRNTREIFRWLDENGYKEKEFDTLVSHWHDDHAGNTAEIIENYNVGTVYIPPIDYLYETNEEWSEMSYYERLRPYAEGVLEAAKEKGTRIVYTEEGQEIDVGTIKGEVLYCCGCPTSKNWYDVQYINNQSSVIMFTGGGSKYLTCGDLQNQAEKIVLRSGYQLKADIFKMSHHGYIRSNMQAFVNAVNPSYSYFTSNKVTETTYAHEDLDENIIRMGALSNVMSTHYNGTIVYRCSEGVIEVQAQRNIRQIHQLLLDKETGETSKVTLLFNDASPIHLTKKVIGKDKYYNRRIYPNGLPFPADP